jgi:methylase of polypeptide subunit release factors
VGVGSGAGAAVLARRFRPRRLVATDVNPTALRLAAINLAAAGVSADLVLTDGLEGVPGPADLVVANPPFIAGDGDRTYRDGGDMHGARISLDWTLAGARILAPAGRMLLYTGSAIVDGRDRLRDALEAKLDPAHYDLDYAELDPDIFGGQLGTRAYRDVERIAAIGAVVTRRT